MTERVKKTKEEKSYTNISINLCNDINDRLLRLSNRTARSKTFYIREAVLDYLDKYEDYYLKQEVKHKTK